ncbi:Ku protein [Streptomyces coeruleorubidus]|uniref:Ku protein n=1 Tax=Streptomyces coeruleorubidus TaxID=116188 RepID=UPI0037890F35
MAEASERPPSPDPPHLEDMGRVRVRKYCEIEDREVDQGEIGKGYQLAREQVIPIGDEELRDLPMAKANAKANANAKAKAKAI